MGSDRRCSKSAHYTQNAPQVARELDFNHGALRISLAHSKLFKDPAEAVNVVINAKGPQDIPIDHRIDREHWLTQFPFQARRDAHAGEGSANLHQDLDIGPVQLPQVRFQGALVDLSN